MTPKGQAKRDILFHASSQGPLSSAKLIRGQKGCSCLLQSHLDTLIGSDEMSILLLGGATSGRDRTMTGLGSGGLEPKNPDLELHFPGGHGAQS